MKRMCKRELSYVPALIKIFDEVLVNAADNKQRDPTMTSIRVNIDKDRNEVSVWNDGEGIPVEIHSEEGVYIPSLIFGTLLTSSNYDDSEIKIIGGRNGFGAKLCNIFSKKFTVETRSAATGNHFEQTWRNNMSECDTAIVKSIVEDGGTDFTKVTFEPDLKRFSLSALNDATIQLMQRRVVDVAGTLKGVEVFLNGHKIDVGFWNYPFVFDGFEQFFSPGGRHVDYVCDQLIARIKQELETRFENGRKSVRPLQIKNRLCVFLNSFIENPTFDSQTKEYLASAPKTFGSKCQLSEAFFRELFTRTDIIECVIGDLNKRRELSDLPKLEDAGNAGTVRSSECTLILTEGDSAKALAVAGLAVVGRKNFGVFPLRGKLTNVRGLNEKMSLQNAEVSALVRILGLRFGEDYSSDEKRKELRYGHLMIMTDQDEDGAHIRGLIINFLHSFWPSLIRTDFIHYFMTPLLKARRGAEVIPFFSSAEFERWKQANPLNAKKYSVKYYKGLGTSSAEEAREYFTEMRKHRIEYEYGGQEDDENIEMAFDKNRADDRKAWIIAEASVGVNGLRSVPSAIDGLKPSQRKVLHTLMQRFEKSEIKVVQLAGAIAHYCAYHHGEQSLVNTIVRLAQDFVGANNLNLLLPIGQFGTRSTGGEDCASARYIYTALKLAFSTVFSLKIASSLAHSEISDEF
ncbi:unnamed protein product [Anisakis simplex]|uniref:DNA topoisomerase 2 n=1 Tax=Anisakis simplex TaxID=6269 RepID=A0A3P6MZG5_ANISI|nr:unnamed protein product [Anisakis simplex]